MNLNFRYSEKYVSTSVIDTKLMKAQAQDSNEKD